MKKKSMVKGMSLCKSSTSGPIYVCFRMHVGMEGGCVKSQGPARGRAPIGRQGVPKADALDVLEKRRQGDWSNHGLALFSDASSAALLP